MISAKIITHSKSAVDGKEIVTFELEYPRFIHGELMTHRMFSRNAASSRAIPVKKIIEMVRDDPATPIHWGKNQAGMQAKEELKDLELASVMRLWDEAADEASITAGAMDIMGAHKQIVNRVLEPFQWMKTVVTATEWDNFFWLRNHPDAQPEIHELAKVMLEALAKSEPFVLQAGDWHTPYFGAGYWLNGCGILLEDALAVSASCCAQVSYRKLDDGLEKAKDIYARLVESEPVHASPFEHQASPMKETIEEYEVRPYVIDEGVNNFKYPDTWEEGVTHSDRSGNLWSGNFKGWIQHRQLIPNNVCNNYNNKGELQ